MLLDTLGALGRRSHQQGTRRVESGLCETGICLILTAAGRRCLRITARAAQRDGRDWNVVKDKAQGECMAAMRQVPVSEHRLI